MEYKIQPKEFNTVAGIKTVNSIMLRGISWDRINDNITMDFYLEMRGPVMRNGVEQNPDNMGQNLRSEFLVTELQKTIYDSISVAEDATDEEEEEARTTAYNQAQTQVQPLLKGLNGTAQQCYMAASALAAQFDFELLPIEEQ